MTDSNDLVMLEFELLPNGTYIITIYIDNILAYHVEYRKSSRDSTYIKLFNLILYYKSDTKTLVLKHLGEVIYVHSKPLEKEDFVDYLDQFGKEIKELLYGEHYTINTRIINFKKNVKLMFSKLYNPDYKIITASITWLKPKIVNIHDQYPQVLF